ncbi:MAG TPA: homocysteine S-methyltransferase [Actinomycetota bacterium]
MHTYTVLDGGLATELERRGEDLSDHLWSARLLIDDPALIRQVHSDYFEAGAQVAITATYQASVEGFAERGIDRARADDLMRLAVQLARDAADQGRKVAASIGPFGATLANGSEYTGNYGDTSVADLTEFHRVRAQVLATTEADLFAVETIPSLVETEALAVVLGELPEMPAWVSFSCRDGAHLADGTPIDRAARVAASIPSVIAVGVNCTPGGYISPLLQRLRETTALPAVVYPNAGGRWDAAKRGWTEHAPDDPTALAHAAPTWIDEGARWVGGCCGFGVDAIAALAAALPLE